MEVRLFGELEAVEAGVPVPVRGAKQRALLALLALRRGQPVSADRLIDMLWAHGQAANPANAFAERSLHEATRLLERLLLAAEEGGRTGRVIEILVLRALAHPRLGDIPAALSCLERAMTLAEPRSAEPRNSTCCREPATGNPDPSFTDPSPGAGHTRRPSSERPAPTPMNGSHPARAALPARVEHRPRVSPSPDRVPPSGKSPHQSPRVVMPSHHIRF
jgi:MalT-like TPR region